MPTIKLQSDDTWLDGSSYPISKTGLKSQLKATDALRHKLCYDFVFSLKQACFTDLQQGSVTRFLQLHGLDLRQLEIGQKPERRIGADFRVRWRGREHLVRRNRHLTAGKQQVCRPVEN